jgi:hypothetical protein
MKRRLKYYLLLTALLLSCSGFAQQPPRPTDGGASLSFEYEKTLRRHLTLGVEEELRFITNRIGFDRSVTSGGLEYAFLGDRAKIGAWYAFIYLYNNDFLFEPRHRFYINLSFKENLAAYNASLPLTLSWRGRIQETIRDENHGSYRINPRYVMKNKFEADWQIWGRPWKPYISCDISTNLNDPETRYDLARLRFQAGAVRRLNRTDYINFFVRWDEYRTENDPRVVYLGFAFKIKK